MAEDTKTEAEETEVDGVFDQGVAAKEAGIDADQCPYGEGELKDRWIAGHDSAKAPKAPKAPKA